MLQLLGITITQLFVCHVCLLTVTTVTIIIIIITTTTTTATTTTTTTTIVETGSDADSAWPPGGGARAATGLRHSSPGWLRASDSSRCRDLFLF